MGEPIVSARLTMSLPEIRFDQIDKPADDARRTGISSRPGDYPPVTDSSDGYANLDHPDDSAATQTRHPFKLLGALQGRHRPSRVARYGTAYLAGYTIAVFLLVKTGVLQALAIGLHSLGASRYVAAAVPLALMAAYALLWLWFLVSLWQCAVNAESHFGYELTRGVALSLAVLIGFIVVIVVMVPT